MTTLSTLSFTTSCAAGLESLAEQEIEVCGGSVVERARGLLFWDGYIETAYRLCLWSRFSSRIFLKISEFPAPDEAALYAGSRAVEWEQHMDVRGTFVVDASLSGSALKHSHFAALRVKDAVADRFRERSGRRPWVDLERPDVRIRLHCHKDTATLSVDLSGNSLHRRGYRVAGGGMAPLKESLAAAIVALSGWNSEQSADTVFLDPMCGSGTLLVEAALIYGDSAPGLSRSRFGFMGWKGHNPELWSDIVTEAVEREERGLSRRWPQFIGYDADPEMVAVARKNIEQAGLADRIVVKQGQLGRLRRPSDRGFIVCNPPYGERVLETEEAGRLYQALGHVIRSELYDWNAGIFASNPDMGDRMGIRWKQSHRLLNGPIACRLFCSRVKKPESQEFRWQINPPSSSTGTGAEAFANRLYKNLKKTMKWAGRNGITCFRVYDRDIPEYNVTVDIYEKWVLVQEYAPPATVNAEAAAERFKHILEHVRSVLNVGRDRVFIKTRRRQKGKKQYQKQNRHGKMYTVHEGPCRFLVNFTDYLDTGIFLDHRITRKRIGKESAGGKRFLNLYGYTGTATVYAAVNGAESTTTVDLSGNYLSWTRQNMCLNGFGGPAHETVKADCLEWLGGCRSEYDIIFADPPTFSNTKKHERVFDVQQDHVRLINLAMKRLAPGGLLIFSCNFRKFRLDGSITAQYQAMDITRATIPHDFKRNRKVHQCWKIRRT